MNGMEALSSGAGWVHFVRHLSIFLTLCLLTGTALAHPALIPLPSAMTWHEGSIAITADTTVEGRGQASATADYLVEALGLKEGGRAASRIRLSRVAAGKVPNPEGYRLRAAGKEVLIEASDPRGLFYGAQTLRQLVTTESGSRSVPWVE